MPKREHIQQYLEDMEEATLLLDGFDEALIGFAQRVGEELVAVYSWEKIIGILVDDDEMTEEEAEEYAQFNIVGAWVGPKTPMVVYPFPTAYSEGTDDEGDPVAW